jgi:hypothetical protein
MDKDAVEKMGMTPADVTAMIAAWTANVQAYRNALVAAELRRTSSACGQRPCRTYAE